MTSNQFRALSGAEQHEITRQVGVALATRENNYFHMTLYRVYDFYVEFKRQLLDGELWIGLLDHDILLTPYLDQIDITELS